MKRILSLFGAFCFGATLLMPSTFAVGASGNNISGDAKNGTIRSETVDSLNDFAGKFQGNFFAGGENEAEVGTKGVKNFLLNIARDGKNLVTIIAGVLMVITVLIMLFGEKSEEGMKKAKNILLYSALGIMLMQASVSIIGALW